MCSTLLPQSGLTNTSKRIPLPSSLSIHFVQCKNTLPQVSQEPRARPLLSQTSARGRHRIPDPYWSILLHLASAYITKRSTETAAQISDGKSKWQKKLHLPPLLKIIMEEKSQEIVSIFNFYLSFCFKLLTHPRVEDDTHALRKIKPTEYTR